MTPAAVLLTAHRSRRETCTRAALAARTIAYRYAQEGEPKMARHFLVMMLGNLESARYWRGKEREATREAIARELQAERYCANAKLGDAHPDSRWR